MVLAIDVGNSNIVIGGYTGAGPHFVARIATNRALEADQYAIELRGLFRLYGVADEPISAIAIASVVPQVTPMLLRALRHFTHVEPMLLSRHLAPTIHIDIANPDELGTDIIASAIAVEKAYPLPAVIIDMGTATKLTALDTGGRLPGVSIAPGLLLSLNALVTGASALSGISLAAPDSPIGRTSAESMNSGLVLGTADMLDGMIDRFERAMGGLKTVIATGGAAPMVVPHCRHNIVYSETLLLDGLYEMLRQNGATES